MGVHDSKADKTYPADMSDLEGTPNTTIFVGNLSFKVSEAVILKIFTPFGKVVREQFCYHTGGPRKGEPRGFCFVEYATVEEAAKAIRAVHGRRLYGRPVRVRFMNSEGRMDYSPGLTTPGSASHSGPNIPAAKGDDPLKGMSKLSLDKKVALLKLKLREARKA
ncbi:unnamed protein product [Discosporangium mesarthrocarpum]